MLKRLPIDDAGPEDSFAATRALSSDERVLLALRLGDEACSAYAEIHGISLEEAGVRLKAARQVGRIPLFDEASQTP